MDIDGSNVEFLTEYYYRSYRPDWSPDGTQLLFMYRDYDGGQFDIHVMDADGTNIRKLTSTTASEFGPRWSPDGNQIAFSRNSDIHVMNSDGTGQRRLTKGNLSRMVS